MFGGHFGRHLGFHTLKMFRKNVKLFFLKAYDIFLQNQVSFCYYQKKIHEITNMPTLIIRVGYETKKLLAPFLKVVYDDDKPKKK